jgi:hypothetical protein
MDNRIINSFIYSEKKSLKDIFLYLKRFYVNLEQKQVCKEINNLIKKSLLIENNKIYILTKEGNIIKKDNIYYNSKIIYNFIKKYSNIYKKYSIKEIRIEQKHLRDFLIKNKEQKCIICNKFLPLCLLETAHLKPRCLLKKSELYNTNNVELMCKYCHSLYDNGYIGINNGKLVLSNYIINNNFNLKFNNYKLNIYNNLNKIYFIFHYNYIFNYN